MSRCVVVTKDLGAFNVASPVAIALKEMGNEVTVLAEGLSVAKWKAAGFTPVFEGSVNFTLDPFAFDADRELAKHNPDVVLLTSSTPINIEASAAISAARLRIPQAWIEDVWGVTSRMPDVEPDLVFTLDVAGEKMLRADSRFTQAKIVIAGNPAINNLVIPEESALPEELVREYQNDRYRILFSGHNESTRDIVNVLITSLVNADAPFAVIPRWHPKRISEGNNRMIWEAQIEMLEARRPGSVLRLETVPTDLLAALCDITVSGWGTPLLYAANHRKAAVSITTPATRQELRKHVRHDRWPGLDLGIGIELTEPVPDLIALAVERGDELHAAQNAYFKNPPLTPMQMAEELLTIAR